jgi:hypothetical protein
MQTTSNSTAIDTEPQAHPTESTLARLAPRPRRPLRIVWPTPRPTSASAPGAPATTEVYVTSLVEGVVYRLVGTPR